MKKYNKNNFWDNSFGEFTICEAPTTKADKESLSSKYWFTNDGMYRSSDHWGYGIESCDWFITGWDKGHSFEKKRNACAFIKWESLNDRSKNKDTFLRYELWNSNIKQFIKEALLKLNDVDYEVKIKYGCDTEYFPYKIKFTYLKDSIMAELPLHRDIVTFIPKDLDINKMMCDFSSLELRSLEKELFKNQKTWKTE